LGEFFEDLDPNRMGNDFEEVDSFLNGDHFNAFSFRLERTASLLRIYILYNCMQILLYINVFVKHSFPTLPGSLRYTSRSAFSTGNPARADSDRARLPLSGNRDRSGRAGDHG
jgi:hypothetical protein